MLSTWVPCWLNYFLTTITKHSLNLYFILVQKREISSNLKPSLQKSIWISNTKTSFCMSVSLNLSKLFTYAHWQPQVSNSQNFKHKLLYYLKHTDSAGYSISFPGSKTSDQLFSTANENANAFKKFHSNLAFLTFSDNNKQSLHS